MMRQQQGSSYPKAPKLLEVVNKNILSIFKGDEETDTDESLGELPESSSEMSKFEREKKDEDGEDPNQPLTIQFGKLPPVMANNYMNHAMVTKGMT